MESKLWIKCAIVFSGFNFLAIFYRSYYGFFQLWYDVSHVAEYGGSSRFRRWRRRSRTIADGERRWLVCMHSGLFQLTWDICN